MCSDIWNINFLLVQLQIPDDGSRKNFENLVVRHVLVSKKKMH
jgi:hypothetical protein